MNSTIERVKTVFEHEEQRTIVRAELWLGRSCFKEFQMDDSLEGHLSLRSRLGMDLLFLPLSVPGFSDSPMDYRRFGVADIEEAIKISDLFVAVILDGPFQRLVDKHGLLPLLSGFKDDEKAVFRRFEREFADLGVILKQCLEMNVGAVVVADDLAYQHATYMNPEAYEKLLGPLYSNVVAEIHTKGAYALFHSCGNITALIPQLVAYGFDGLAACQDQCLDLFSIKKVYGARLTFLAGMDADILEAESLTEARKKEFSSSLKLLAKGGGFILSSSCGLNSRNSLQRLQELYHVAEESVGS
jgi:uroporphyrinogen decarboxylase